MYNYYKLIKSKFHSSALSFCSFSRSNNNTCRALATVCSEYLYFYNISVRLVSRAEFEISCQNWFCAFAEDWTVSWPYIQIMTHAGHNLKSSQHTLLRLSIDYWTKIYFRLYVAFNNCTIIIAVPILFPWTTSIAMKNEIFIVVDCSRIIFMLARWFCLK